MLPVVLSLYMDLDGIVNFQKRVAMLRQNQTNEQMQKQGVLSPLGSYPNNEIFQQKQMFTPAPPSLDWIKALATIPKQITQTGQNALSGIQSGVQNIFPRAQTQELSPSQTPTPTVAPSPTQIPMQAQRIEPYATGSGTPAWGELYPKLQKKEAIIQPATFDAIMKNVQDDYKRRMAMALSYQESTGGLSPEGDIRNGVPHSFGDYHIQPGNAPPVPGYDQPTEAQARDSNWASRFLSDFMDYNELGASPAGIMRRWNYNSGYTNKGPKYNVDIPRFATMAAFIRGK